MKNLLLPIFLTLTFSFQSFAQRPQSVEGNVDNWPVHEYELTIDEEMVNLTGDPVKAMTINGGIPGPVLEFTEGEYAKIHVTNKMDVETSVHWHGLLLPNFFDGVPYLTTPPIRPGETFTYEFALKQSGTYWYHSHTGLQEQRGVYGSIQINPREQSMEYDKDLVLVLSDWMDEKPHEQLRNLKRGNEWYLIKKGQVQSLNKVLAKNALGAKLKMSWQRMPDMAISDNYHDLFLVNGLPEQQYPDFESGEKVRLRFVNASAASYFWLTFGGEDPFLVAADGLDVVPVKKNKTLIAVAETYDFIVTVPESGKLEIRATSQDGSGHASAYIGEGEIIPAPVVPEPDLIEMMKKMMAMDMKMGAPASKFRPGKNDSIKVMKKYAMEMDHMEMDMDSEGMKMKEDHTQHDMDMNEDMKRDTLVQDKMKDPNLMDPIKKPLPDSLVIGDAMKTAGSPVFNYDYLRAPAPTTISDEQPLKEILFNLTGNMNRYVWSINGVPLSETDKIKIEQGQKVRITLNNLTMMHHPMHLHGHFFRVINKNGEYSPLKHTVNVAPMQKTVIEFDANEYGDWFFHCHVLYHLNGGMARVFSYDTPRDERLEPYPLANLTTEANEYFTWGEVSAASHMTEFYATTTNIRNQFRLRAEYGWNENVEATLTYERYLNDYFRVFAGGSIENEEEDNLDELESTAIGGIRYLLPLLIDSELSIDHKLRPQLAFNAGLLLFPRLELYGEYEYQIDFGWNGDLEESKDYETETVFQVGLEYVLSKGIRLMGSYDNRFGAGGGISLWF
ncbi:multicopper oxidase domain-containing protein [Salinimicrobium sediminilitoris]|uniref:multicopper oxidase domain-containing protein n=1 Tax=Salinimicrobium sediminilitoris TaxID=2876715 RepID=UPI001E3F5682|nr:multicopper oxidase domain-containing protein [Salinimicrobium sediminilitoris]MCC8359782.1 multicopper oxidase domain-containing protein [Salinimicrobium sediminilitoris]